MNHFKALFEKLNYQVKELEIVFNPPAKAEELKELEKSVQQSLPKDIIEFYHLCNGLETNDFLFRILPIKEILEYKDELPSSSFYFAEYMIYSDAWVIELNKSGEYTIKNGNHDLNQLMVLTNSISEFLERYLKGGGIFGEKGLYNWIEEINEEKNYSKKTN